MGKVALITGASGGTARQVTTGDVSFAGPGMRNSGAGPVWTNDGRHLLVSAFTPDFSGGF